jgi:hypothetical protein
MNADRVDMWFMPFEESHEPPMLDPTSELSSYSGVSTSPVSIDPLLDFILLSFSIDF